MRRNWPFLLLGAAILAQLLATLLQFPLASLLSPWPIHRGDFNQHFYYAHMAAEFFRETGRFWGYDTNFMAGVPGPTIVDDNKLLALLFVALPFVAEALLFKLFVFLSMLAPPVLVWLGARRLGEERGGAAVAAALAAVTWVLDPFIGFFREVGLFPFNLACALLPAAAGLARGWLARGERRALVLLVAASPLVLVHYLMPLLLAPVLAAFLLAHLLEARRVTRRTLAFAALGGLLVLWVLLWLVPFIRTADMKTPSGTFWVFPPARLLQELALAPLHSFNSVTEASVVPRNLSWLLGGWGLLLWWRAGRRREAAVVGGAAAAFLALAYGGRLHRVLGELQPYRFVIAATSLLLVPAGSALLAAVRRALEAPRALRPALAICPLLLLPTFWSDYGHFRRGLRQVPGPFPSSMSPEERDFLRFLEEHTDGSGRVLFENHYWFKFPCHLPLLVPRQLIGGPYPRSFIQHNHANFVSQEKILFGRPYAEWNDAGLLKMLDLYNVRWLVTLGPPCPEPALAWARGRPALFREVRDFGSLVLFDVPREGDWFLEGGGRVEAVPGLIRLRDLTEPVTAIKYHWFDGLGAEPEVPIERLSHPGDPVGFIRVRNGSVRDLDLRVR